MSTDGGFLFTSESVTEGHPDKVADQISDAIVDAALATDPESRVAVETLLTTGLVVLAGEITTKAVLDFAAIARQVICDIGYDNRRLRLRRQRGRRDHRAGPAVATTSPAAWTSPTTRATLAAPTRSTPPERATRA